MTEKSYHQENSDADNMKNITLDPRAISPLDRARSKRRIKQKPSQLSQVKVHYVAFYIIIIIMFCFFIL